MYNASIGLATAEGGEQRLAAQVESSCHVWSVLAMSSLASRSDDQKGMMRTDLWAVWGSIYTHGLWLLLCRVLCVACLVWRRGDAVAACGSLMRRACAWCRASRAVSLMCACLDAAR